MGLAEPILWSKVKSLAELKAIATLEAVYTAQMLNYLKAYRMEVGLLINSVANVWISRD